MNNRLYIFLLLLSGCLTAMSQNLNFRDFKNIAPGGDATSVTAFAQDSLGLIWIGTNRGLYSYDGYTTQEHNTLFSETWVHCLLILDNERLCIGTENGLLFYNYKKDSYEPTNITFPSDIRSLCLIDNTLWIGSLNGLYRYQPDNNTLDTIPIGKDGIPHRTIYSLAALDKDVLIGTYNGLSQYLDEDKTFKTIELPNPHKKNNLFVNVLLKDSTNGCIWIGTEGSLLQYFFNKNEIKIWNRFNNNSVKSLAIDVDGNLLAGTDDGLFVCNIVTEKIEHIVHDSRRSNSLTNNIIWAIFNDRENNVWLGTDYNISLAICNNYHQPISIAEITESGDGNRFYNILKDSGNRFWLGGSNGIIRTSNFDKKEAVKWYRMGDNKHAVSHNRIRDIYEDAENNIWIAGDGSISRFDESKDKFINYTITDSSHVYNSNWAYNIIEDSRKNLWIATWMGGVFVVDKQKLLASDSKYVAEKNFTTANGLSSNHAAQVLEDKHGSIWVLLYKGGLNKIDALSGKVENIDLSAIVQDELPSYMLYDKQGMMWLVLKSGIVRLDTENYDTEFIPFNKFSNNDVLTVVDQGDYLWIATINGLQILDKKKKEIKVYNTTQSSYTAGFYDSDSDKIYWGGNDELAIITTRSERMEEVLPNPILLSQIYINNKLYTPDTTKNEQSIRYSDKIELNYKQNNIAFVFSDLDYTQSLNNKFVCKLADIDKDWKVPELNKISYSNLPHGTYHLKVAMLDSNSTPLENHFTFTVVITPPFYLTIWVKLVYMLGLCSMRAWSINFFRVKNKLKIERIEKEKTLELSKLKMDFLTNVSHELKTPLSLIIAPLNQLITETKDANKKQRLKSIQEQSFKINSLIKQIIDFNRVDDSRPNLVLSKVEFVGFAKSIFSIYEHNFKQKGIQFIFESNVEDIYITADILKMESILNNLLVNACKYTEKGTICLSLDYNKESKQLIIEIEDTGIGIPQHEIAYVTSRFYQSSKTINDKTGSGIGLYLAKNYIEQHQGILEISSVDERGTIIKITLNDIDREARFITESLPTPIAPNVNVLTDTRYKVAIVEDNIDISNLIYQALNAKYDCQVYHNGKQALNGILQNTPNLIVTDIMMPVMDGVEMIRQLKSNLPTSTIPIILLTAKDDKETQKECIKLKVDNYIAKPFDVEMLLYRIDQLLNKQIELEKKIKIETLTIPKSVEIVSPDEKLLSTITNLIEDHLDDSNLNVAALSTYTGIGTKQIYRKLKQLTGLSPVEYIRSIRIKKAAMLLAQNKFTITEVMYMVGFSDYTYFTKCFQAEFNKTPREYMG